MMRITNIVRSIPRRMALLPTVLLPALLIALVLGATPGSASAQSREATLLPANGARNVAPDTHLTLIFAAPPVIGTSGKVRIYDRADNRLVDMLDLAIPASPNPTGRVIGADGATKAPRPPAPAGPENPGFQFTRVGGQYFHFFPIIVRGNTATIYPHNNALEYGRTYRVEIDAGVIEGTAARSWTFSTKRAAPPSTATRVTVSADGRGDFNTVQGAIDWAPANPAKPVTIFIRNGNYEEIVFLAKKSNLILRGESRDGVVVGYANNSAFNRVRPAFTVTDSTDIQLSTFTIKNYFIGQAEALLMRGQRYIVDRMTLNGSGDAFTTHGTIYMVDSLLTGDGDTILAYAALYCLRCEIRSVGPFTWTRTPKGSHGNVFIDSTFVYVDKPLPWSITAANPEGRKAPGVLARLPRNGAANTSYANFPHAEMVLINARTQGIPPEGWGPVEDKATFDWSTLRLMEFGTTDMAGAPVDLSRRHPAVRILTQPKDSELIANYRDPAFVLGGWKPVVR
jgi:pectinesterase